MFAIERGGRGGGGAEDGGELAHAVRAVVEEEEGVAVCNISVNIFSM
jgi:hypothetical protein